MHPQKFLPNLAYTQSRRAHWDKVAQSMPTLSRWSRFYQQKLAEYYRFFIPPGLRVLELGCGRGDLLAALEPSYGVGIDFSGQMLKQANAHYPSLHFVQGDAHALPMGTHFDVVILSDLVNDLWDVQQMLEGLQRVCQPHTRIILNTFSYLWEAPLTLAQRAGLSKPSLEQNWLAVEDLEHLLHLTGYELVRRRRALLLPLYLPLITTIANRYLAHLWPFNHGALTNFLVARPAPCPKAPNKAPLVSVIVPARNEAGNIQAVFERTPEMGAGTELVFVEGHSTDDTFAAIQAAINQFPQRKAQLHRQTGKGKGDAVRLGFSKARGDILMILDADLTVPPEDLSRFYEALVSGKGEFINGVRLVYPMENQAMRSLNKLGNKFFSIAFSWLLGQPIKDTLCGTKVLWKKDYQKIADNRAYFGDFDPFGDFDLLFGAARLNLKIVDLPVRYQARRYGQTNISRWKHGWLLLRMVAFAAGKLKFV